MQHMLFCLPVFNRHSCLQVDVLVDGFNDDGELVGRTQWDAPDVDPIVFLAPPEDQSLPDIEIGQIRRCLINGNSLWDLEAHPVT